MLHQVAVVDVDEHALEAYYNVETPLNEFLVKKYVKNMCHTRFKEKKFYS